MTVADLRPGDRVLLRCRGARLPIPVPFVFQRIHDAASIVEEIARTGAATAGQWQDALASGRGLAAFQVGGVIGVFQIHADGALRDDMGREVEVLSRRRMGRG